MCDPLTIASVAMTAAGTGMQKQSAKKAERKQEQAISRNAEAQEALRRDSQAGVMTAAAGFTRPKMDETQNVETAKLAKQYTENLSNGQLPGEYYGGRQSENTRQYAETKTTQSNDFAKQMADALANLRGFDQGFARTGEGISRAGEKVVMNNGFMDGNNAVLPIQLEAAKRSAANPIADAMVGIGSAGMTAGLSGASFPGMGTASKFSAGGIPIPVKKPPVPTSFGLV